MAHVACAALYLALAVLVVARRPRALLNRTCGLLILCFAHWSGCLAVSHHPDVDQATAGQFYSIGSFAWASFASFAALFITAFLRPALVRSRPFQLALAGPPLVVIYAQWAGRLASDYPRRPWGHGYTWSDSPVCLLFYTYYGLYMLAGLGALAWVARRAEAPVMRRQAGIMASTALVPLALSSATDVWLPRAGISSVPNMAPDFTVVWVIGLVYAVVRYRMLELTPAAAADQVVENMSDALLLAAPDGRIAWSNPAALRLFGYDSGELGRMRFADLVTTGLPDVAPLEAGRRDLTLRQRSGAEIEVSVSVAEIRGSLNELVGKLSLVSDITARKRAERELRRARDELESRVVERTRQLNEANTRLLAEIADRTRSEERYRRLIESMQEGVVVLDAAGHIRLASARLGEMLGYEPGELVGRELPELVEPRAGQEVSKVLARVQEGAPASTEWELRRRSGERLSASVQAAPLRDERGAHAGAVLTMLDVTERKEMQLQLARSERLASLGMLAAGVGHEINNPLTAIIANLEDLNTGFAAGRPPDPEDCAVATAEALEAALRVRDIVRDLRSFSRGDSGEAALIDVHDAIEDAAKLAHHHVRYRARLVRDFAPGLPPVLGSRRSLSQVMLNLLVNAAHAIDEGRVEENEIRVRTFAQGELVFLEVSDTGRGISAEDLPRVFDPFFSTKAATDGLGLGLAISHELVEAMGGRIEATSEPGKGSRFTVRLKAKPGAAPVARSGLVAPGLPRLLSGARFLVVDDEPTIRRALVRILGEQSTALAVDSAQEAMRVLAERRSFDLLFCDLMMPGISGMALIEWIAEHHPELSPRVVVMTGGAFMPEAERFLERSRYPLLEKPFQAETVLRLAAEQLGRLGPRSLSRPA